MGSTNPDLDNLNEILMKLQSETKEEVKPPIINRDVDSTMLSTNTTVSTNTVNTNTNTISSPKSNAYSINSHISFENQLNAEPQPSSGQNIPNNSIQLNELRNITERLKSELESGVPKKNETTETSENSGELDTLKPIINTLEKNLIKEEPKEEKKENEEKKDIEPVIPIKKNNNALDSYKVAAKTGNKGVIPVKPSTAKIYDSSFPGDPNLGPILNMLDEYIAITSEEEVLKAQKDYNTLNNGNIWVELPKFYGISTTPRADFYDKLKLLQKFFGVWHKPYFFSKGPRPQIFEDPMCYPENEETKTFIIKIFETRIKTLREQIKTMEDSGIQSNNLILKQRKLQIDKINVFLESLRSVNNSAEICKPILEKGSEKGFEFPGFGFKCNCMKELKQLTDLILLTLSLVSEPDQKAVVDRLKELKISQIINNPSVTMEELHTLETAIRDIINTIAKNPNELKKPVSGGLRESIKPILRTQGITSLSGTSNEDLLQDIYEATSNIVKNQIDKMNVDIQARNSALEAQADVLANRKQLLNDDLAKMSDEGVVLTDDEKKDVKELLKLNQELANVPTFVGMSDDVKKTLEKFLKANEAITKKIVSPLDESVIAKIHDLLKQDSDKKFSVTIHEIDKEALQEAIDKYDKELIDEDKTTLGEESIDILRNLLTFAEELDTINLVLPLSDSDAKKLKTFVENNDKLGGEGDFSGFKKLVSGEDETKLRDFILTNDKLNEMKDFKPVLDVETVEKLKALVEKVGGGSNDIKSQIDFINTQEEEIKKALSEEPIRNEVSLKLNTKDPSKLVESINNNMELIKSNLNPFHEVLTLLSIDKNLRNKIKDYLENPTDAGLLNVKTSIQEDENAAEDIITYLQILLGYELEGLGNESIPVNIRYDILNAFDFGPFVRNPEKEFSEILDLLEEFMLNRSTMEDYKMMRDPTLVASREQVDFALSDSYPYLEKLLSSRIKNANSPYTGLESIPEEFSEFIEDKNNIFYHICIYPIGGQVSLKRIDDTIALEKAWKQSNLLPLNFLVVRFLQILKQKFEV